MSTWTSPGPAAFMQGIIDWNKRRYGINVINHDNLGITTGVHSGLVAALRAFSPPGSKVLMMTPIYNGFYYDLPFTNTVANESQMKYVNGKYEIDWDDLERRMTPDTKTMILCNPNNPDGQCLDQGGAEPDRRTLPQAQDRRPVGRDPLRLRHQGPEIHALQHPGQQGHRQQQHHLQVGQQDPSRWRA